MSFLKLEAGRNRLGKLCSCSGYFISQVTPYDDVAKYDLDMASTSLVKYYEGGKKRGTTYPDMPWEPKESFRAVATYYAEH